LKYLGVKMVGKCSSGPVKIRTFTCSGSSNVGQIANQVAIQLDQDGVASMSCLAGIGAHLDAMVETAKTAESIVVIDGCPTECARKTLEKAGIAATNHFRVTDEGITKNHDLKISKNDIDLVARRVKRRLKPAKTNDL
jgi:uncharacterized metal-binding protein